MFLFFYEKSYFIKVRGKLFCVLIDCNKIEFEKSYLEFNLVIKLD